MAESCTAIRFTQLWNEGGDTASRSIRNLLLIRYDTVEINVSSKADEMASLIYRTAQKWKIRKE